MHTNARIACLNLSRAFQQNLLAVSCPAVRDYGGPDGGKRQEVGVSPEAPPDAWKVLAPLSVPKAAVRWYGDNTVRTMLSWFWQPTYGAEHEVM